jgi:hypothetical protein
MATPEGCDVVKPLVMVMCEICKHHVGFIDPDKFHKPLKGDMFTSPRPGQMPDPFPETVDWMWIRCPMCHKRPFQYDDRVMSVDGKVIYACRTISATPRESETPEPEAIMEEEDQPSDIKGKGHGRKRIK